MNKKIPAIDGFLWIMIILSGVVVGFHLFLGV